MKKILVTFFFLVINLTVYSQPKKIMLFGNSITQANTEHDSYRFRLWEKLTAAGFSFDFVGSLTTNYGGDRTYPNASFDKNHEGHFGWFVDEFLNGRSGDPGAGKLSTWLANYTPDVVLMHAGTNDAIWGNGSTTDTNQTVAEIEQVINVLRADNPNVVIMLAKLIPTHEDNGRNTRISALNAGIPGIVSRKNTVASPVILVDQNAGFNAATDTYDGVHPNTSGEEKMAQKWAAAIINYFVPLPIQLLNFGAAIDEGKVNLTWTTTSEQNNDFFSVQHSIDGKSFSEFTRIQGAGNSSKQLQYSAIHSKPVWGVNYYRLMQTDFDGKFTYSTVVTVNLRDTIEGGPAIYPNPANDYITIDFSTEESDERLIQLFDSSGRKCLEYKTQGENVVHLQRNGLSSGIYMIHISSAKRNYRSCKIALY